MAAGSILRCQNFPGYFEPKPPTVHTFHSSSSQRRPSSNAVLVLGQDLFQFYHTCQVSEGLGKHVLSSEATQIIWFRKLMDAWRNSEQVRHTPKEVSQVINKALEEHLKAEVEELLSFYGLAQPHTIVDANRKATKSLPKGVKLELHTLPVDGRAVADGDTITVYVRALDPQEISCVPSHVLKANIKRNEARALRNYAEANVLHQEIINSGYRVIRIQNEEVLARKYRIRLRGIDAPESEMPYGKEATEELTRIVQGKSLRILIYEIDCYGRFVGDIYCNNIFVQELMLKKGFAWYYSHYDKRTELKNWEEEARVKQAGLWASPDPEEPWEWRKNQRNNAACAAVSHRRDRKSPRNVPPRLQRIPNS
ncbi:staphylococcal-like nuclease CAN1 [Neltuma alba]|uniref:staphylococcal-like nuclease CAN1 n=1 Tax=Neltuma alba TaxID=207710 RepID=UPI0010A3255D|nr:staphylococcal-like nuclease CAN1 [Prosopis alba]